MGHYAASTTVEALARDLASVRERVNDLEEALREVTVELARLRTEIRTPTVTDLEASARANGMTYP
jgi:hypothetical protein